MAEKFFTEIKQGDEARNEIAAALSKIAVPIGKTLGPNGANAAIDRPGMPTVTKDGVTVLHDLEFSGKVDRMVYETLREIDDVISKEVGDGTTSTILLIEHMYREALRYMSFGWNPREIIKGMEAAVREMLLLIKKNMVQLGDTEEALRAIVNVAGNGEEEIVQVLTDIFMEVGDDGLIFVRDAKQNETTVSYDEGYVIPQGPKTFESFAGRQSLQWERPYVLVLNNYTTDYKQLTPILQDISLNGETKNVLVIYQNMSDDVLKFLAKNTLSDKNPLNLLVVKMPLFAERQLELIKDFEAWTDAKAANDEAKIDPKTLTVKDLGRVDQLDANRYELRMRGGRGLTTKVGEETRVEARIRHVKQDRDYYTGNVQERNRVNERLAKLQEAIVVLTPGGHTETEQRRKKGVYEDAIRAVQAGLKEGVIPGGGIATYNIVRGLTDRIRPMNEAEAAGYEIIRSAAQMIFKKLCQDAGTSCYEAFEQVIEKELSRSDKRFTCAFNFRTMEAGDMFEVGVIDPFLMVKTTYEQALSMVKTFMLASETIVRKPTEFFVSWKDKHQRMAATRY